MQENTTAVCVECQRKTKYVLTSEKQKFTVCGITSEYIERGAKCVICGSEVYVPEINDENVRAREERYKNAMQQQREK